MKRRGLFGFLAALGLPLLPRWTRAADAAPEVPPIPPVTGIKLWPGNEESGPIWNIDPAYVSRQYRPNHRPELFRYLSRCAHIERAALDYRPPHSITVPPGAWALHDHPRSHIKLPPIDTNLRSINVGYLPGTEPDDHPWVRPA